MATYIKDDSIGNLQSALQFLAQQNAQRQSRDLQRAELRRLMGDNYGAEEAVRSSEQGFIGNLYDSLAGYKAKEWEVQNPFRGKEIGLKEQLSLTPEARQGQTLLDINAVKELKKIYGKDTNSLNAQLGLMGITGKPQTLVDAYKQQQSQKNDISAFNKKAEAYNKSLANIPASYQGNEVYQQQQLMNDTINAIQNGGGLAAYNRYVTTGKAISDHYGHSFQPLSPAFFGIGSGGKAGAGEKTDAYLYGDTEQVVHIPAWAMKRSKDRESYISKHYPDIYREGTILKRAGTNSGESLNPLQKADLAMKETMIKEAEFAKADDIRKQTASIFSGNKTDIDNANKALAAQGSNVRFDYDGNKYQINQNTDKVAKKDEEPLW